MAFAPPQDAEIIILSAPMLRIQLPAIHRIEVGNIEEMQHPTDGQTEPIFEQIFPARFEYYSLVSFFVSFHFDCTQ